jgi:hypothetical protein
MSDMNDAPEVQIDELFELRKFEHPEGEETTDSQYEVERLTINNGIVLAHSQVQNGEVVGPVPDSELIGKDIGKLIPT